MTAGAWVLAERGYAGTTTNHVAERAGVNIASLYEYFPGKDAIVALVAERLVERVMARLEAGAARVARAGPDEAMGLWMAHIFETIARERELVAVFQYEVPYTSRLAPVRDVGARLVAFSQRMRGEADGAGLVDTSFTPATLHLVVNLVTSTILELVLDPPEDVSREEMLAELTRRVEGWIRGTAR